MAAPASHSYRYAFLLGVLMAIMLGGSYIHDHGRLLGDPDSFWHIKLGRDILSTGHFPVVDTYSHSFAGKPFVSKEWLSEIIFAAVHQGFGWSGVLLFTAIVGIAVILVLYRELAMFIHPTFAALFSILAVTMLSPVVVARPHLLTLPITAYFTARLLRAAEKLEAPSFWLLVLVSVWANLHGSFILAFVIAGFAFLHVIEKSKLSNPVVVSKWLLFLLACPLAAMVHPYGVEPLRIGLNMMATNAAMSFITEWMPFNAHEDPMVEYYLLAFLAGLIGLRLRLSWAKVIFIIFVLHMLLSHIRFIYGFFLLVPIVIVPELADRFPDISMQNWLQRPRDVVERFIIRRFYPLSVSMVFAALIALLLFMQKNTLEPTEDISAEKPIAYALANHLDGPVFNEYSYGGSLIFHGIKTFVDGRAEQLFLGDFFTGVINSNKPDGAALFKDIIDQYHITWTLLPIGDLRNGFLQSMGWKKAYVDDQAVIFTKPMP